METTCLMLMTTLHTAVDLDALFDSKDLDETYGVEHDSHITVFYKKNLPLIPKSQILPDLEDFLGPSWKDLQESFKEQDLLKTLDNFYLDVFEGSPRSWLVLRLSRASEFFQPLEELNRKFSERYDIKSDFSEYNPHMTLAAFKSSKAAEKYLGDEALEKVLKGSLVSFDDLTLSYGTDGVTDYTQFSVTSYHSAERHLRKEKRLREDSL